MLHHHRIYSKNVFLKMTTLQAVFFELTIFSSKPNYCIVNACSLHLPKPALKNPFSRFASVLACYPLIYIDHSICLVFFLQSAVHFYNHKLTLLFLLQDDLNSVIAYDHNNRRTPDRCSNFSKSASHTKKFSHWLVPFYKTMSPAFPYTTFLGLSHCTFAASSPAVSYFGAVASEMLQLSC